VPAESAGKRLELLQTARSGKDACRIARKACLGLVIWKPSGA